jgi:hypothetical protein
MAYFMHHDAMDKEPRAGVGAGFKASSLVGLGWRHAYLSGVDVEETSIPVRIVMEDCDGSYLASGGISSHPSAFSAYSFPYPIARVEAAGQSVSLGDWCLARPRGGSLELIAPLARANAVLGVANVDRVLIVLSAQDPNRPGLLERGLRLSWEAGARPIVVLSKCDLVEAWELKADELRARAFGVQVIPACLKGCGRLDALKDALKPASTSLVLGPRAAGKSSLIEALGAPRAAKHVGRGLRAIPGGAFLVEGGRLDEAGDRAA